MSSAIQCPSCGKSFNVSTALTGKRVRCKGCQTVFAVPASTDDATDELDLSQLESAATEPRLIAEHPVARLPKQPPARPKDQPAVQARRPSNRMRRNPMPILRGSAFILTGDCALILPLFGVDFHPFRKVAYGSGLMVLLSIAFLLYGLYRVSVPQYVAEISDREKRVTNIVSLCILGVAICGAAFYFYFMHTQRARYQAKLEAEDAAISAIRANGGSPPSMRPPTRRHPFRRPRHGPRLPTRSPRQNPRLPPRDRNPLARPSHPQRHDQRPRTIGPALSSTSTDWSTSTPPTKSYA